MIWCMFKTFSTQNVTNLPALGKYIYITDRKLASKFNFLFWTLPHCHALQESRQRQSKGIWFIKFICLDKPVWKADQGYHSIIGKPDFIRGIFIAQLWLVFWYLRSEKLRIGLAMIQCWETTQWNKTVSVCEVTFPLPRNNVPSRLENGNGYEDCQEWVRFPRKFASFV